MKKQVKKLIYKIEWLEEKPPISFLIEITDKINEIIDYLKK